MKRQLRLLIAEPTKAFMPADAFGTRWRETQDRADTGLNQTGRAQVVDDIGDQSRMRQLSEKNREVMRASKGSSDTLSWESALWRRVI
jgi:hypothetical protein